MRTKSQKKSESSGSDIFGVVLDSENDEEIFRLTILCKIYYAFEVLKVEIFEVTFSVIYLV